MEAGRRERRHAGRHLVVAQNFPIGGEELWKLRVAGKRPDDMVVVSLIGPTPTPNPLLWVGDRLPDATARSLEWRMLAGLDVEIVASGAVPLPRLLMILRGILPHARDVFVHYPDAGFRIAVRFLDPSLPPRVVDYDDAATPDSRALAGAVARRLAADLRL